jgi:hypothetical protein
VRIPIETPSTTSWAPRSWAQDAILYGASASFAAITAAVAEIPLQRSWGRAVLWPYGIAALIALIAAWSPSTSRGTEARHHRRRTALVLIVFAATALLPMIVAAARRADDPGAHAQSEVIIVEEAARATVHGHDPYGAEYGVGPLSDRPAATQVHFPYLPGMLAFGLPRALAGHAPWTDARVWFTVVALAVAGIGLLRMATADARIRTFQVLFALPTGALLLATGGVDVPVIAMLLATAALVGNERSVAAGVAGGLALAAKQTSILVLPFLLLALPRGLPRRRSALTAGSVAAALIVPFALWNVGAFVEDAVLFPLNLGQGESAAATPTVGSLLLDLFPSQRTAVTVLLVAVILGVAGLLLVRERAPSIAQACARAAGAFLTAAALAPAARAGYLVYPANLIVWAIAFRAPSPGGRGKFRSRVLRGSAE